MEDMSILPLPSTHFLPDPDPSAGPIVHKLEFEAFGLPEYKNRVGIVIDNLFDEDDCKKLLDAAESSQLWAAAAVNGPPGTTAQRVNLSYRNSSRIIHDNPGLAEWMLGKLRPHLAGLETAPASKWNSFNSDTLRKKATTVRLLRINERLRYLKYGPDQFFRRHCDGPYYTPDCSEVSYYTIQLYLCGNPNSLEGGATRFWPMTKKTKTGEPRDEFVDVDPRLGRVLIFEQDGMLHIAPTHSRRFTCVNHWIDYCMGICPVMINIQDAKDVAPGQLKSCLTRCLNAKRVLGDIKRGSITAAGHRSSASSTMYMRLAFLLAAAASVHAHTIFQKLWVNGVDQGYLRGIRHPTYDGPITDVTSNDIICNGGPNPLVTPYPSEIINIPAGATVGAEWHHVLQPNGYNPSDSSDPIDPSHKGPVMVYLANVDSALQTSVTGLEWFKIYEDGLSGGVWGVDRLIQNKGIVNFRIPECIQPGNYFLRAELIALHPASSYPGAQFYMECAQINITGGGSANPPTVSFPGAYKGSDPGITINIYNPPPRTYTIPGPRPFTCDGAPSSSVPPPPSTTVRPSSSSSSIRSSSFSSSTTSSAVPSSSAVAPHYGQCGGQGWTGPIVCESSWKCTVSNQWYSQCL
ncbi:hypothetical protein FRB99_008612 [Tulasnella sp. 403]|nr:hypothetical protein FRB99_008612 [Tulasnella sp. 403]